MDHFLSVAALFSMNVVQETRLPCQFVDFDYFTRVKLVAVGPIALVALIFFAFFLWALRHHDQRRRGRVVQTKTSVAHAQRRGSHDSRVKTALWKASFAILFVVDLLFPMITRPSRFS